MRFLTARMVFAKLSCMPETLPHFRACCKAACLASLLFAIAATTLHADWLRDNNSIAWRSSTNIVWRFNFDTNKGKPYFHPVSVAGGPDLTNFKPEDHPWHYGLWFSWKYMVRGNSTNHVNYWEEDRATGRAQGRTRWDPPVIVTSPDGGAIIRLNLTYINPSNQIDLTERREITVSPPSTNGAYGIQWKSHFTVGDESIVLDRTPMPGEPGGQVNGGYAGLAFRMAGPPLEVNMLSTAGPVTNFVSDRARPNAPAAAFNFTDADKTVGSLAILGAKGNAGENPPWYLIHDSSRAFRFACAAILAPKPISLPAYGQMDLNYCILVQPQAWTVESLRTAQDFWFP